MEAITNGCNPPCKTCGSLQQNVLYILVNVVWVVKSRVADVSKFAIKLRQISHEHNF